VSIIRSLFGFRRMPLLLVGLQAAWMIHRALVGRTPYPQACLEAAMSHALIRPPIKLSHVLQVESSVPADQEPGLHLALSSSPSCAHNRNHHRGLISPSASPLSRFELHHPLRALLVQDPMTTLFAPNGIPPRQTDLAVAFAAEILCQWTAAALTGGCS
jgi:hypothetical protein